MTAIVLVGLMVASAFVLAITWIEPRVLGGPIAWDGQRAEGAWEPVNKGHPGAEDERRSRRLEQAGWRILRSVGQRAGSNAAQASERRAA